MVEGAEMEVAVEIVVEIQETVKDQAVDPAEVLVVMMEQELPQQERLE